MTRRKKTRNPGAIGVKAQPKALRTRTEPPKGKDPKRSKGKPAGNRHSAVQKQPHNERTQNQDPRHGSKRKVPLVGPVTAPELTAEQRLLQIENDERLMAILAEVEEDNDITPEDEAYMLHNLKIYRQLVDELGLDYLLDDEDV